ncbi:MAG: FecR family protein [Pyrinomonadaceae bacterium]
MTVFSFAATSENSFKIYAQSGAVEARVTSVSGAATLSGNGLNSAKLARRTILAPGHEIDTRGGGRIVIDLSDGSQVVVLPGSRLVVGDYRNAGSLRELLQITLGRIRVRINHFKNKPNPYRIKSPTASIAVRGTEFEVRVESLGETRVVVFDGAVEVASLRDPSNPLLAEPGRGVIVRPNFTLDFFVPGITTGDAARRNSQKDSGASNQTDVVIEGNSEAAKVYERFVDNVVQNGDLVSPSRFTAFADRHLDSLDNPAYAAAFDSAEGRVYFAPSFSDASNDDEQLNRLNPVDYSIGLQGTIFVPLNRFRSVIGASGSFVNNGLQSFSDNTGILPDVSLLPLPPVIIGNRAALSTTNNKFFDGSLIVARKFGSRDQTSVGLSYERFTSSGGLTNRLNRTDANSSPGIDFRTSGFGVYKRIATFGVKHDFGGTELGAFYRYNKTTAGNSTSLGSFTFPFTPSFSNDLNRVESTGSSSEIGFRLRGAISGRFFYGAKGNLLFGRSREEFLRNARVDSKQNSATTSGTIGFGLGYFLRSRTVFSFDLSGGFIKVDRNENEVFIGNLLERGDRRTLFISPHAAVQTDVWRNLFVSASIQAVNQSRTVDARPFSNRLSPARDSFTDVYSNYGAGWRFKPNFIFQYIVTTDYGKTAPRHAFNFRYTFNFSRE